jgi:hypothetical protein
VLHYRAPGEQIGRSGRADAWYLVFTLEFGASFQFQPQQTGSIPFGCEPDRRVMVIAVNGDFFYGMSFALH